MGILYYDDKIVGIIEGGKIIWKEKEPADYIRAGKLTFVYLFDENKLAIAHRGEIVDFVDSNKKKWKNVKNIVSIFPESFNGGKILYGEICLVPGVCFSGTMRSVKIFSTKFERLTSKNVLPEWLPEHAFKRIVSTATEFADFRYPENEKIYEINGKMIAMEIKNSMYIMENRIPVNANEYIEPFGKTREELLIEGLGLFPIVRSPLGEIGTINMYDGYYAIYKGKFFRS